MRFQGKRVVVTGAASGIGRAAALRLAAEGATVAAIDQSDCAALVALMGGASLGLVGDAGDETFVTGAFQTVADRLGGVDAVFANAGISGGIASMEDITVAEWERVLRVNLVGVFLAIREASRHMARGAIVATASVAGLRSGAGGIPYSASKAGVINLVQTSAQRLAGRSIRINAILPGLTETGMTAPMFEGARARGTDGKLGQLNPLRRAGAADEAAALALWLLSDDASYVNGQAIAVDGGLSSSLPVVPGKFV